LLDFTFDIIRDYLPLLMVLVVSVMLLGLAHTVLIRHGESRKSSPLFRQLTMVLLTIIAAISVTLALPIAETSRSELLRLLGLVVTGVFALSSTTFVANAMAGFMLRSVKSFNLGDFIRVNEHFGRVAERGLFHTEIQSEDSDLITLPNLYLTRYPVKVVRASGTVVTCKLSLGYDIPYYRVEPLLKQAGSDAGLQEPFVQLLMLGDNAITYQVAGFCTEVKQLLTLRTRLRKAVLDQLHGAGIEIVSPSFINQRRISEVDVFTAPPRPDAGMADDSGAPEQAIFDKADRADKVRALEQELADLKAEIKSNDQQSGMDEEDKVDRQTRMHQALERVKHLENILRVARENDDDK